MSFIILETSESSLTENMVNKDDESIIVAKAPVTISKTQSRKITHDN